MQRKNKNTIAKEETLRKLYSLDQKFKFDNPQWDNKVKEAFNNSGSFSFENLVYSDFDSAKYLVDFFS